MRRVLMFCPIWPIVSNGIISIKLLIKKREGFLFFKAVTVQRSDSREFYQRWKKEKKKKIEHHWTTGALSWNWKWLRLIRKRCTLGLHSVHIWRGITHSRPQRHFHTLKPQQLLVSSKLLRAFSRYCLRLANLCFLSSPCFEHSCFLVLCLWKFL